MDYTNNIGLSAFLEDAKRFGSKPNLKDFILHNEKWYIYRYIKQLRYVEQYYSKCKLLFLWHFSYISVWDLN